MNQADSLDPGGRLRASVIVPVRNGRRDLERLLDALAVQTIPRSDFEVVIADDGSTDGTTEWLRELESDWVRVTAGGPHNSYAARNRAVAISRSDVLAFCDADCVPVADWLERGLAALGNTDVAAGRVRFILPTRRTVWTLLDMDTSKDHEREVRNGTAETANLFLRRELFDRVGGFEETIPEFGDFDFAQRAVQSGATLSFANDVVVWHPTRRPCSATPTRALDLQPRLRSSREPRQTRTRRASLARPRPGHLGCALKEMVGPVVRTRRALAQREQRDPHSR